MKRSFIILTILLFISYSNYHSQTNSTYRLNINRIDLPLNNNGVLADVYVDGTQGARFDSIATIFSAGFYLSGYSNGNLWANGVATSSRIHDYISGKVNSDSEKLYVLKSSDIPFGDSWQEWSEAVELGAYFYDGDDNGVYNPVDLNNNGSWDENEDRPDLLGDETIWCVYNDGLPSEEREFIDVEPQGIEIRQTVWAIADEGDEGNVIYVRYSLVNKSTEIETFDSVFFAAWADTDLGDYHDDLTGTDLDLNSVYVYNDSSDTDFGDNPPAHYMCLLQGPWVQVSDQSVMAYNNLGDLLGVDTIIGAKNLRMTSSANIYRSMLSHDVPDEKEHVRYLQKGLRSHTGEIINPCDWPYGIVKGIECEEVPLYFIYSGDPVSDTGWLDNLPFEQRMMVNTGPFTLTKNEPIDIIIGHVVARGEDYLSSITETKRIVENISGKYITEVKEKKIVVVPENCTLHQNYPNPFNPTTTLSYSIPKKGMVELKVYDVLGREVATLVDKEQHAGSYDLQFDASSLTSGIYFYQLRAGGFVESRKMVLLK